MIKFLPFLICLSCQAQFGSPKDLAFWGKKAGTGTIPTDITGLWVWSKADTGYVMNNLHAVSANNTQPTYWTNVVGGFENQINGTTCIYLVTNGLGQTLMSSTASSQSYWLGVPGLTNSQPLTIFTLVKFDTNNQQIQVFFDSGNQPSGGNEVYSL